MQTAHVSGITTRAIVVANTGRMSGVAVATMTVRTAEHERTLRLTRKRSEISWTRWSANVQRRNECDLVALFEMQKFRQGTSTRTQRMPTASGVRRNIFVRQRTENFCVRVQAVTRTDFEKSRRLEISLARRVR